MMATPRGFGSAFADKNCFATQASSAHSSMAEKKSPNLATCIESGFHSRGVDAALLVFPVVTVGFP